MITVLQPMLSQSLEFTRIRKSKSIQSAFVNMKLSFLHKRKTEEDYSIPCMYCVHDNEFTILPMINFFRDHNLD